MIRKSLTLASLLLVNSALASDIKFDAGMGLNYGGIIGATANIEVAQKTEVFAGLGTVGAMGYVVGGRYYLNDNIRFVGNCFYMKGLSVPGLLLIYVNVR